MPPNDTPTVLGWPNARGDREAHADREKSTLFLIYFSTGVTLYIGSFHFKSSELDKSWQSELCVN